MVSLDARLELARDLIGQLLSTGDFTRAQLRVLKPAIYQVVPRGHPLRLQLKLMIEECQTCESTGLVADRSSGRVYPGTGAAFCVYLPCPECGEERGKRLHGLDQLKKGDRVTVVHHQSGIPFRVEIVDHVYPKSLNAGRRMWSRKTGWLQVKSLTQRIRERARPWVAADDKAIAELGEEVMRRAAGR